ncbi:magoh, partial [Symbiodinium pilosum]
RALWVLREEPDGETLRQRFAQFGFEPRKPPEPRLPRRRKLPRAAAEDFLIRNALGPPSWSGLGGLPDPGSETEPEEEAPDYEARKAQRQREDQDQERSFSAFLQQGAHAPDRRAKRLGPFGAAAHPLMLRRAERRAGKMAEISLELGPLFNGEPPGQNAESIRWI